MLLGSSTIGLCALCHLCYGIWCIHLSFSWPLVVLDWFDWLGWQCSLGSVCGIQALVLVPLLLLQWLSWVFWLSLSPGIGASCVPFEFHQIQRSAFVCWFLLMLAMCYSYLLGWLWSMFPRLGAVCSMDGRLYAFNITSWVLFVSWVNTAHNFSQFALHPWSMGGSLVILVRVPSLWIVTPWSPGRKTVVYSFFGILFTLRSDFVSPGSKSASLAFGAR